MSMSFTIGSHVAVMCDGHRYVGMIAFDNEDGTLDVILQDGSERDAVSASALESLTEQEKACVAVEGDGLHSIEDRDDAIAHTTGEEETGPHSSILSFDHGSQSLGVSGHIEALGSIGLMIGRINGGVDGTE